MRVTWTWQFLRFLLVGVTNTVVGLSVIFLLIRFAGWGDLPANLAGYLLGLCCSFLLNRRWTFQHQGWWLSALMRFVLVFAMAYAVNVLTLLALRDWAGANRYLAHALATVPYTITFFLGSRLFAFRANAAGATV